MKNLFTIFVSPEQTFQRLKSSKVAWLIGLVVLIALSLVVIYLQMPVLQQVNLDALKTNPQIPVDSYDTYLEAGKVSMYVMAVITPIISIFLVGLLLMLLNLIVRGEAKYMQLVNLTTYAMLPSMIGGVLLGVLMLITDARTVTDVSLSLGAFISDKESVLYKVFSIFDPFTIWTWVLYVIGASVMMNRPKKKVGAWIITISLAIPLILVLIQ